MPSLQHGVQRCCALSEPQVWGEERQPYSGTVRHYDAPSELHKQLATDGAVKTFGSEF